MRTHLGSAALEDLERAGLRVHAGEDHAYIGTHHRMQVRIDVAIHEPHGRTIALSSDGSTSMRQLPLSEFQAHGLVHEFAAARTFDLGERIAHTLEHLLLRVSHIAEQLDLSTMTLDPVAVAEGGYCIDAAALTYQHQPPAPGIDNRFRQGRDNVIRSPRYHERH